ncbi:hypothetical protein COOONC_26437 [Cooperia oncophora]
MKVVSGSKFMWHGAVEQRKSASQNVNSAPPSKVRSRGSGNQKPFSSFLSSSTEFRRNRILEAHPMKVVSGSKFVWHGAVGDAEQRKSASQNVNSAPPSKNRILKAHPMKVVSGSKFMWHGAVGDAEQRKSASQNVNSAPPSKVRSRRSGNQKPFFKFRFGKY